MKGLTRIGVIFAVLLLIGLSALGFLLLDNNRSESQNQNLSPTATPSAPTSVPNVTIVPTSSPTPTLIPLVCNNSTLKINFKLPDLSWKCQSLEDNLTMQITSPTFNMLISSYPKQAYCDSNNNGSANTCELELFYFKNGIDLKMYRLNGAPKEVFGNIIAGPQITLTWSNMEGRQLSILELEQITSLLDSIKYNYVNPNHVSAP